MTETSGSAPAFGDVLRELREVRALTQEELAERALMSAKAIGALERGERRRPYPATVRALADALGLGDAERARMVAAVPRRDRPAAGAPAPAAVAETGPARARTPTPTTPILGRERDLQGLLARVGGGERLLTLTGPGGVGKTRLALELVAHAGEVGLEEAVVVELAPVRDPAMVVGWIAAALGIPDRSGAPAVDGLVAALADRPMLLVLDNVEQVLACAGDVLALVGRCPDLVVLCTSRAPLRVRAEHEVPLGPLPVPDGGSRDAPGVAASVQLLADRCAAAGTVVDLAEQGETAAAVCRRLDGLPLAVELAAAASRLLTLDQVLARLEEGEVVGELRDLPDRQRTMTDVLTWSLDLLSPEAGVVFPRLAVFVGGFDLDAAAAVAGRGDPVDGEVGELLDHALLVRLPDQGTRRRFRLLEPVRQHAMRELHRRGEALDMADRHAHHHEQRALAVGTRVRGPASVAALDELEGDHADLRAASRRLVETGQADRAAALAHATWLSSAIRGQTTEALAWAERLVASPLGAIARGEALLAEAGLRYARGDLARTGALAAEARPAARSHARDELLAEALLLEASAAIFTGDVGAADRPLGELDEVAERLDDPWYRAHRTILVAQGAMIAGDVDRALDLTASAVERADLAAVPFTMATARNVRASLLQSLGDHAGSARPLAEAAGLGLDAAMTWTLAYSLPGLATAAAELGQPELAATLFGASAALVDERTIDVSFPTAKAMSVRGLEATQRQLDEAALSAAWRRGRIATRDELAELAARVTRCAAS